MKFDKFSLRRVDWRRLWSRGSFQKLNIYEEVENESMFISITANGRDNIHGMSPQN